MFAYFNAEKRSQATKKIWGVNMRADRYHSSPLSLEPRRHVPSHFPNCLRVPQNRSDNCQWLRKEKVETAAVKNSIGRM